MILNVHDFFRAIRTLRPIIQRMIDSKEVSTELQGVKLAVGVLNDSYNSQIDRAPNSVTPANQWTVLEHLLHKRKVEDAGKKESAALQIGQLVRIAILPTPFMKEGRRSSFSQRVYRIVSLDGLSYHLETADTQISVPGSFVRADLLPTEQTGFREDRRVQKVIRRSVDAAGERRFLVKFVGWPDTASEWVTEAEYERLKLPKRHQKK